MLGRWAIICSDMRALPALLDPGSWGDGNDWATDDGSVDDYGDGPRRNPGRKHEKGSYWPPSRHLILCGIVDGLRDQVQNVAFANPTGCMDLNPWRGRSPQSAPGQR